MDKWLHGSRHASLGIRKQTRHRESSERSTATRLCMARYAPSVRSISTSSSRIGSAAIAVSSPRASASCCFNCASCCSQPGAEKGRGSLVKLEAGVREGSEQDGETASRECDGDTTRKGANAAACRFGRGGEGGGKGRCRRRGKGRCRTMLTQLQRSGRAGPHVWTMHTQGRARAAHGSHLERRTAVEGGMLVLTVSTTTFFPYWQGEGSAKQDR